MSDDLSPEKQQAERNRIVKSKAGGFGTGKEIAPIKREMTERIAETFEDELDKLSRLMKDSFKDAMAPTQNIKIRLDAAHKLMGHLHRPAQGVKLEGTGDSNVTFNIVNADSLSQADRELLERTKRVVHDEEEHTIDLDSFEELED